MTVSELPEFEEGDVLELRGYEYSVERVDPLARDRERVLQYRLERVDEDAPPATLKTAYDEGEFSLMVHYAVDPDDIERTGGDV